MIFLPKISNPICVGSLTLGTFTFITKIPLLIKISPTAITVATAVIPNAILSPHFHISSAFSVYFSRSPHSVGLVPFHSDIG